MRYRHEGAIVVVAWLVLSCGVSAEYRPLVLVVGDSISNVRCDPDAEWGYCWAMAAEAPEDVWHALLESDAEIVNVAEEYACRFDTCAPPLGVFPDRVILQGAEHFGTALFPSRFSAELWIDRWRQAYGVPVVCVSTWSLYPWHTQTIENNAWLETCDEVVDVTDLADETTTGWPEGADPTITWHPNSRGHQLIANAVRSALWPSWGWTNDPLLPSHGVAPLHARELRARIDELRLSRCLHEMGWSDVLAPASVVSPWHLAEARYALGFVVLLDGGSWDWSFDGLMGGLTFESEVRTTDVEDVREAVELVESFETAMVCP